MDKLKPFIVTADYRPQQDSAPSDVLRRALADQPQQLGLWPALQEAA
jgi:hypothetical protein